MGRNIYISSLLLSFYLQMFRGIREVCVHLKAVVFEKFPDFWKTSIGAVFFLRFIGPGRIDNSIETIVNLIPFLSTIFYTVKAILFPKAFDIMDGKLIVIYVLLHMNNESHIVCCSCYHHIYRPQLIFMIRSSHRIAQQRNLAGSLVDSKDPSSKTR